MASDASIALAHFSSTSAAVGARPHSAKSCAVCRYRDCMLAVSLAAAAISAAFSSCLAACQEDPMRSCPVEASSNASLARSYALACCVHKALWMTTPSGAINPLPGGVQDLQEHQGVTSLTIVTR